MVIFVDRGFSFVGKEGVGRKLCAGLQPNALCVRAWVGMMPRRIIQVKIGFSPTDSLRRTVDKLFAGCFLLPDVSTLVIVERGIINVVKWKTAHEHGGGIVGKIHLYLAEFTVRIPSCFSPVASP